MLKINLLATGAWIQTHNLSSQNTLDQGSWPSDVVIIYWQSFKNNYLLNFRVDNPYIQMLSSQDNLDGGPRSPSTSLQSPPSDHSTFSPTLSEVHAHLVRSPPPISWPIQPQERPRYYPVSPRSTGTFSPDSSDGLELVRTAWSDQWSIL